MRRFYSRRLAPVMALVCLAGPALAAPAQSVAPDAYTLCSFYPQAKDCEAVYRQALTNSNPAAESVTAAYEGYGRYLRNPADGLTSEDRKYLSDNQINLPSDLSPSDLGGLHNVINDPVLAGSEAARRTAVNNFINRALEAELYCDFNVCEAKAQSSNG